jgi:hypothetical protein
MRAVNIFSFSQCRDEPGSRIPSRATRNSSVGAVV